jgi:hypothetical protein
VAGTAYWKRRAKKQRALATADVAGGEVVDVPAPRAPTSASTSLDKP